MSKTKTIWKIGDKIVKIGQKVYLGYKNKDNSVSLVRDNVEEIDFTIQMLMDGITFGIKVESTNCNVPDLGFKNITGECEKVKEWVLLTDKPKNKVFNNKVQQWQDKFRKTMDMMQKLHDSGRVYASDSKEIKELNKLITSNVSDKEEVEKANFMQVQDEFPSVKTISMETLNTSSYKTKMIDYRHEYMLKTKENETLANENRRLKKIIKKLSKFI